MALTSESGKVNGGCVLHPDNEHIIFPLGTTIVVRHIMSRTQRFLRGHDNDISVIIVSSSGKYIASGQKTHMGFQVSLWLFSESKRELMRVRGLGRLWARYI